MKQETITFYYEHCGECPNALDWYNKATKKWRAGYRCGKRRKLIRDLWGAIPDWCPLPDKEIDIGQEITE